jgi:hypothetical protein
VPFITQPHLIPEDQQLPQATGIRKMHNLNPLLRLYFSGKPVQTPLENPGNHTSVKRIRDNNHDSSSSNLLKILKIELAASG